MPSLRRIAVAYRTDTSMALAQLRQLPFAVALDSGGRDRWDIVCAQPAWVLQCDADGVWSAQGDGAPALGGSREDIVRRAFGAAGTVSATEADLPFAGGLIGFLGYEFAHETQGIVARPQDHRGLPLAFLAFYPWALVTDHASRRTWLAVQPGVGNDDVDRLLRIFGTDAPHGAAAGVAARAAADISRAEYMRCIGAIKSYLLGGDCYQVNYTQRYRVACHGRPSDMFRHLQQSVPSPFGAYIDLGAQQILSISPERFVQCDDGLVMTQPIKGTRARAIDVVQDRANAEELLRSAKDRAENVMIVDLLRNDLGKVCEPGSIRVERLCELQSFANVHHLVSTVTGRLRAGATAADLLLACFPGGSITGAPKRRAMQIINELERYRRGIYCGSIFYAGTNGRFDSNIAIRTLLCSNGEIIGWAGGGIVADSAAELEYAECEQKIRPLFDALLPAGAR